MLLERNWVCYFPGLRLGGVEEKRVFPVLQKSCSVTWKGNAISALCLGFFGVFFCLFCFVISSAGCYFFLFVFPFPLEPRESLECVFVKAAACKGLNPSFGSVWLLARCPHSTGTSFFPGQKSGSLHLGTGGFCRTIPGSGSGLSSPKPTFSPVYVCIDAWIPWQGDGRTGNCCCCSRSR